MHDRYSTGSFCRVEFGFSIREGLRTFCLKPDGSGVPVEPAGTLVQVLPLQNVVCTDYVRPA